MDTVEMYKEAKHVEVPANLVYAYIEKGFEKYEPTKHKKTTSKKDNKIESEKDSTAK